MQTPHQHHRRYPGAVPFETWQSDIFFGRTAVIEELYHKILLEKLVVLYGKSGDGKSSLINAGIIPRILVPPAPEGGDAERDVIAPPSGAGGLEPIKIRFEAFRKNQAATTPSPVQKAFEQINTSLQEGKQKGKQKDKNIADRVNPEDISLWKAIKNRQMARNQNVGDVLKNDKKLPDVERGYLLIFDQFEELFTYPDDQFEAFGQQLAEVLNVLIPMRYVQRLDKVDLSDAEKTLLHTQPRVHVLLSIRSDRLQLLNLLQTFLPNIQKVNYQLPPLSIEDAEDAVLFPALKDGAFDTPKFDYDDAALQKMTDFLTKQQTQAVASFQLQILCESIEDKAIAEKLNRITAKDIGNPETLFENYYRDKIEKLPRHEQPLARHLIEDGLIYEEEDRRLSLYEGQIHRDFKVNDDLLTRLIDVRLLRAEPSQQGGYTYELSHDTLVRPVAKLKAIRKEEERLARERKARWRLAGVSALALLGFAVAAFATWQFFETKDALKKVEEKTLLAEKATREANAALAVVKIAEAEKFINSAKRIQALDNSMMQQILNEATNILADAQKRDSTNTRIGVLQGEIKTLSR